MQDDFLSSHAILSYIAYVIRSVGLVASGVTQVTFLSPIHDYNSCFASKLLSHNAVDHSNSEMVLFEFHFPHNNVLLNLALLAHLFVSQCHVLFECINNTAHAKLEPFYHFFNLCIQFL